MSIDLQGTAQLKPPVGLRPEWLANEQALVDRIDEIIAAMKRYAEAGVPARADWCEELSRKHDELFRMVNRRPSDSITNGF